MPTGTTGPCDLPRIAGPAGPKSWKLSVDVEGFRTYKIVNRVEVDPAIHGPYAALYLTPGLPQPGTPWDEGLVLDGWAFFTREAEVTPVGRTEDNKFYDVEQTATTRPTRDCATQGRDDPLLFPDRVEVRTITYQKEATLDRFDNPIVNSAFEQFRGPQVEFDFHRLQVVVEQNVAHQDLDLLQELMHHLNDEPMWGFGERMIKLSAVDPIKTAYHVDCEKYFIRRLTFDIDFFDRCLLDEGTKALRGQWDKVRTSPTYGQYVIDDDEDGPYGKVSHLLQRNFKRYQDWDGNLTRVILNGKGVPWDSAGATTGTADDTPGRICVEYYPNGNFALLDLPADLENP